MPVIEVAAVCCQEDLAAVVSIYQDCFKGMTDEHLIRDWFRLGLGAWPRHHLYGAWQNKELVGYINWQEHGGFRQEAVLELEQVGVRSALRGKGIGAVLVATSLRMVKTILGINGRKVKAIMVTTGMGNQAAKFYERVLGAKRVAVLPDLYREDEQILVARFDEDNDDD